MIQDTGNPTATIIDFAQRPATRMGRKCSSDSAEFREAAWARELMWRRIAVSKWRGLVSSSRPECAPVFWSVFERE